MTYQVCPQCKTDERLYSVEKIEAMYPITVTDGEMEYTGGESHVLDETAEHDSVFCRSCDWGGDITELIDVEEEE